MTLRRAPCPLQPELLERPKRQVSVDVKTRPSAIEADRPVRSRTQLADLRGGFNVGVDIIGTQGREDAAGCGKLRR